jgi:hypothetical protein
MGRYGTFGPITGSGRDPEPIVDTNPRDPEHLVNCLNVTFHVRLDVLQCACQGAEQSTTDGADHVIKRGRHIFFRLDAVELFDPTMDAESNRFIKAFKIRVA